MKYNGLIFLVFIYLSQTLLSEEIEKYFKPALNKTEESKMLNVDYIYMINLDERPEKFEQSAEQLHRFGIYPYRFSAVNGWKLPLSTINALGYRYDPETPFFENGICTYFINDAIGIENSKLSFIQKIEPILKPGRTYFSTHLRLGTIGIVLSHSSILQDAFDSQYETIWVMEDDIEVIQDPHILSKRISELDELIGQENWDILFTDQDTKDHEGNYVPCYSCAWRPNFLPCNPNRFKNRNTIGEFRQIGSRYGAYSMIIRRSGVIKILEFIKKYKIFLPYDLDYNMPDDIKMFTVIDDIVSTFPNASSDNNSPHLWFSK